MTSDVPRGLNCELFIHAQQHHPISVRRLSIRITGPKDQRMGVRNLDEGLIELNRKI